MQKIMRAYSPGLRVFCRLLACIFFFCTRSNTHKRTVCNEVGWVRKWANGQRNGIFSVSADIIILILVYVTTIYNMFNRTTRSCVFKFYYSFVLHKITLLSVVAYLTMQNATAHHFYSFAHPKHSPHCHNRSACHSPALHMWLCCVCQKKGWVFDTLSFSFNVCSARSPPSWANANHPHYIFFFVWIVCLRLGWPCVCFFFQIWGYCGAWCATIF